ncbi:hypothetical protein UFOVP695_2 [uncultured Caudovirales phage]|uniref:Uncharacterized protein n=1 Tax=uncultured Caudovirales phage TaxID=2100421 RepID=A0A6J5NH23_9CAUD|nr:hypothetical protein UFOVP695_2 [uncultured Caudovirales phage]
MKLKITIEKGTSTNDFYKLHYFSRTKLKEKIISNITFIKKEKILGPYEVIFSYNTRVDVDNQSALIKVVIDHIRREGLLDEDYNSVFKKLTINFDDKLPRGEAIMILKKI